MTKNAQVYAVILASLLAATFCLLVLMGIAPAEYFLFPSMGGFWGAVLPVSDMFGDTVMLFTWAIAVAIAILMLVAMAEKGTN